MADNCNATPHSSRQREQEPPQHYKMDYMQHSNDEDEDVEVGPECPMNHKPPGSNSDTGQRHDPGLKFKQLGAPVLELRGREVIFAIAVFFLFSLCVGLVIVLATKPIIQIHESTSSAVKQDDGLCLTKGCMAKAVKIMDALNKTSDPCDNFYEYACTGWLTKATIPEEKDAYSIDNEIKERVDWQLHSLLTTLYPGSRRRHGPGSAYGKAAHLYEKCMDVGQIDRIGAKPIKTAIQRLGGWALIDDWSHIFPVWDLQHSLEELHFTYLTNTIFSFYVSPDDKNSNVWAMQIDQGGLGLPDSSMYDEGPSAEDGSNANPSAEPNMEEHNPGAYLQEAYRAYMYEIGSIMQRNRTRVRQFVSTVYDIERSLAQISISETSADRRDPESSYNNLTISELHDLAPRIGWLSFFQRNFSRITHDSRVIVRNVNYIREINQLLAKTSTRDMNLFLIWKLVSNFAMYLSHPFREASAKFHSLLDSSSASDARWRSCLREVDDWFGMAVGAMFIERHFSPDAKKDVSEMVMNIRNAFSTSLKNLTWMDPETQRRALLKLDAIEHRVGYPDFLTNWSFVDEYYANFHIAESDSYFQTQLNGNQNEVARMRVDIDKHQSNVDDWGVYPHVINAFYAYTQNNIIFPAGILQEPYYNPDIPEYINYGTIGTTIGHELTHAFDNFGAQYDERGNLQNWWSDSSWDTFTNKTQCVVDHYSNYTIQYLTIDGEVTLGENLADIVGVKHAYEAYKLWQAKHGTEPMLPGVNLTVEQIFFVSYAQMWCTKHTPDYLQQYEYGETHSPPAIRVLGPLSQLDEFSEAFDCPAKSNMNSKKKCDVW